MYKIRRKSDGMYIHRNNGSMGYRWTKTGTFWRRVSDLKNVFSQGCLRYASKKDLEDLEVVYHEVTEVYSQDLKHFMEPKQ